MTVVILTTEAAQICTELIIAGDQMGKPAPRCKRKVIAPITSSYRAPSRGVISLNG